VTQILDCCIFQIVFVLQFVWVLLAASLDDCSNTITGCQKCKWHAFFLKTITIKKKSSAFEKGHWQKWRFEQSHFTCELQFLRLWQFWNNQPDNQLQLHNCNAITSKLHGSYCFYLFCIDWQGLACQCHNHQWMMKTLPLMAFYFYLEEVRGSSCDWFNKGGPRSRRWILSLATTLEQTLGSTGSLLCCCLLSNVPRALLPTSCIDYHLLALVCLYNCILVQLDSTFAYYCRLGNVSKHSIR